MKKTSAAQTKFTSLLILAALLVAPIATPTVADAQRVGTQAVRPTASITVNGVQNVSVKAGSRAPVVRWVSKNGTVHKTTLKVNNASLCGVRNGQVWGSGKNAQGTANAFAPTPARAGCVLTFVYEVTNRLGQKASDAAVIRYVAADPAPTKPKPTITNPSTGNTGTGTSTTTTDTYNKLKLLTPNGGERWRLNTEQIISWTPDPHSTDIEAYLEKKVGTKFQTVGKVVATGKGSIRWIGEINSYNVFPKPDDGHYIRIVNTKTGETDRSDKPFTLLAEDTFKIDLQPVTEDNTLFITEAGSVRLAWDARIAGTTNSSISCSLVLFDKYGEEQNTFSNIPTTGTKDVFVELPDPNHNGGLYTLAHIYCDSPLGRSTDYLNIKRQGGNTPSLSIEFDGPSHIASNSDIRFSFKGTNLNVPNDLRAYLYSPLQGNIGNDVVYGNIGETTFERAGEAGTFYAPSTPGQYRLGICDENTPNPDVPFKPLCAHSPYFMVGGYSSIFVEPIQEGVTVRSAEFSGDTSKGIYEFEFRVTATDQDVFIRNTVLKELPDRDNKSAGFVYDIDTQAQDFSGTITSYISETSASLLNVEAAGEYYKIEKGSSETFTVRIELVPDRESEGHAYGVQLGAIQYRTGFDMYATSGSVLLENFVRPDLNLDFTTNKVTIANALPTGVIERTVAQGEAGEQVTLVQAALKKAGLFNEEITGYFGSITRAAVKAFQREHALENVGAVGPQTMSLLNQILGN